MRISLYIIFVVGFVVFEAKAEDHFLIVANGPFEEDVVNRLAPDATVIALDGAAANLDKIHVIPDYILGDFDSLKEVCKPNSPDCFNFTTANKHFSSLPTVKHSDLVFEEFTLTYGSEPHSKPITFVRAYCQDYSDLEKAIQFCASKNAKTITIASALGGERTDHSLASLSILKKYHGKPYTIRLETQGEIIEYLKDQSVTFKGTIGAKFGLFGFPKAQADSQGLMWDMSNYALELGAQESACNILKDSTVTLTINGEALMIRPSY